MKYLDNQTLPSLPSRKLETIGNHISKSDVVIKQWSWHILAAHPIANSHCPSVASMNILWSKHVPELLAFMFPPVLQWTGKGPCQINESQARCEDEHSPKLAMIAPSLVHANPMINHECIQFSYRELIFQDWHSLLGEWVPTPSAATCCNLLAQTWGARLNSKNSKGVTRIPWRKVPKERSKLIWNISNNVLAYPAFPKLMFRS